MTVTLHMVSSLDGYIATEDNDPSWMDASWDNYDRGKELTTDIVNNFLDSIDYYIMGSNTYELATNLGWPYGDKSSIVITSREVSTSRANIRFYGGDLKKIAADLEVENAWLVGGPTLCQEFLRLDLVDKICLSIIPILLGSGTRLFGTSRYKLHLIDSIAYRNGIIDLWYEILSPNSKLE